MAFIRANEAINAIRSYFRPGHLVDQVRRSFAEAGSVTAGGRRGFGQFMGEVYARGRYAVSLAAAYARENPVRAGLIGGAALIGGAVLSDED